MPSSRCVAGSLDGIAAVAHAAALAVAAHTTALATATLALTAATLALAAAALCGRRPPLQANLSPILASQSVDYRQYLEQGGRPFSRDIFLQSKCFCIDQTDFQECACPHCTLMRETTRGWHQQRKKWHFQHDKEGAEPCVCGACSKGSAYREASGSLYKLREFVHAPCGKANFPELAISCGPKSTETVQFYRRQCCRAPSPNTVCVHRKRAGSKGVCDECGDCSKCGWAIAMPSCPIESGAVAEALMAITDTEAKAAAAEAEAATEAAEAAAEAVDALSSKASTQKRQAAVAKAEAAQAKQLAAVQEAEALQAKAALAAAAAMDAEWKEYRPRIEPDGEPDPRRRSHTLSLHLSTLSLHLSPQGHRTPFAPARSFYLAPCL